jgi:RimJ/RimL family protein N-acetyltransferase
MTTLHGLLVDLVPATDEFREHMYRYWNNDSRLWAMAGDIKPISRAAINRLWEERLGAADHGYNGVHFMMRARDGAIIGNIGLYRVVEASRVGWLGSWIGEEAYWGGGHGTDALLLIMDYAFRWLDLRRLVLVTMTINERAQGNVVNCGFKLEARQRAQTLVNGVYVDTLTYGILREEWPGREALVETLRLREKAEQRYGKFD